MITVVTDIHDDESLHVNKYGGSVGSFDAKANMLPNYIIKTPRNEPLKFTKRNNDERMRRSSGMEEDEALSSAPPANSSTTPSSSKTFIDQFIDRSHRITIPDNTRKLAFIHIGKSGGSTISILLRNGCMSAVDGIPCESNRFMKIPNQVEETIASKRILFYLHTPHADKDNMTQYYQRINSVVVVARDPMERFISAFLSRHPVNIEMIRKRNRQIRTLAEAKGIEPPVWAKTIWGSGDTELDQECRAAYNGCFPTLEDLAMCAADPRMMLMMDEEEETITTSNGKMYNTIIQWRANRKKHSKEVSFNCSELCRDIMTGKNRYIQHVRNNYDAFCEFLRGTRRDLLLHAAWFLLTDYCALHYILLSERSSDRNRSLRFKDDQDLGRLGRCEQYSWRHEECSGS